MVTAEFLYHGMPDYWSGNGARWDDDKGCLFAYYGPKSTLRDIIDAAVDDFCMGGDCDSLHEDVTSEDIRAALLDCLSAQGREDYESGALSEFAIEYAEINGDEEDDDCWDSPVCIFLIKTEVCSRCGALADHYVDDVCEACYNRDWQVGDEVITEICTDEDGKPCNWRAVRGVITKIDDDRALINIDGRTIRRGREDFWS